MGTEIVEIVHGNDVAGQFKGILKIGRYQVNLDIQGLNEYMYLAEIEQNCINHLKGAIRAISDRRNKDKVTKELE